MTRVPNIFCRPLNAWVKLGLGRACVWQRRSRSQTSFCFVGSWSVGAFVFEVTSTASSLVLCLQDTLPRAYEYELFSDYLKPYLLRNGHRKYQDRLVKWFQRQLKHLAPYLQPDLRTEKIKLPEAANLSPSGTRLFDSGVGQDGQALSHAT